MHYISIALPFIGLIAAVVVMLTAEPKTSKWLAVAAGGLALVGGLVIYSYGYINTSGDYARLATACAVFKQAAASEPPSPFSRYISHTGTRGGPGEKSFLFSPGGFGHFRRAKVALNYNRILY